ATHQIVGMGEAFRIAKEKIKTDEKHLKNLRDIFLEGIKPLEYISLNGCAEKRIPSNVNITFHHMDGEALRLGLCELALSTGSACNSATFSSSHVLKAIGLSDGDAQSSLRISFGRYTTQEDIQKTVSALTR